jgi:hypothetical protein
MEDDDYYGGYDSESSSEHDAPQQRSDPSDPARLQELRQKLARYPGEVDQVEERQGRNRLVELRRELAEEEQRERRRSGEPGTASRAHNIYEALERRWNVNRYEPDPEPVTRQNNGLTQEQGPRIRAPTHDSDEELLNIAQQVPDAVEDGEVISSGSENGTINNEMSRTRRSEADAWSVPRLPAHDFRMRRFAEHPTLREAQSALRGSGMRGRVGARDSTRVGDNPNEVSPGLAQTTTNEQNFGRTRRGEGRVPGTPEAFAPTSRGRPNGRRNWRNGAYLNDPDRWYLGQRALDQGNNQFGAMPGTNAKNTPRAGDFIARRRQEGWPPITPMFTNGGRGRAAARTGGQEPRVSRSEGRHPRRPAYRGVRVQPFSSDIPQTDKSYRWSLWVKRFKMALELAGVENQRDAAMELSLAAGDEVSAIIMTEGLLPEADDVDADFPFLDFVLHGVADAFERLTDSGVTAREFHNAAQTEKETASEFARRVRLLAKKMKLDHEALITSQFISGLSDVEVRRWANLFHLDLEGALSVAIRAESDPDYRATLVLGNRPSNAPLAIAAVAAPPAQNTSSAKKDKKRPKREHSRGDEGPDAKRGSDGGSGGRCRRCGRFSHRDKPCPAIDALCNTCQKPGHFSAMCKEKQIRDIKSSSCRDEVNKGFYH